MKKSEFPSLNALRVFEAVARLNSFKHAAAELGVTQSAISRQLTTLEQQLGVKLIQRDNRVHALTSAGAALAPELHRIFRQLERVVKHTMKEGESARRLITIGISHELYDAWLKDALEEFRQLYPHLRVRCIQAPEYLSRVNEDAEISRLLRNDMDAMITFGQSQQRALLATELAPSPLMAVVSTQMSTEQGVAGEFELYAIQHQENATSWLRQQKQLNVSHSVETTSTLMALTLVTQQPGVVLVPALYASLLKSSEVHILDGDQGNTQPLTVMIRREDDRELGMVALLQWLQHKCRKFQR
ncbi:MAG: LysR family transcriptional regulator [Idiomarina sp.]|nr:LysR family transcriptional regulator [Idiomarina sp.]